MILCVKNQKIFATKSQQPRYDKNTHKNPGIEVNRIANATNGALNIKAMFATKSAYDLGHGSTELQQQKHIPVQSQTQWTGLFCNNDHTLIIDVDVDGVHFGFCARVLSIPKSVSSNNALTRNNLQFARHCRDG